MQLLFSPVSACALIVEPLNVIHVNIFAIEAYRGTTCHDLFLMVHQIGLSPFPDIFVLPELLFTLRELHDRMKLGSIGRLHLGVVPFESELDRRFNVLYWLDVVHHVVWEKDIILVDGGVVVLPFYLFQLHSRLQWVV